MWQHISLGILCTALLAGCVESTIQKPNPAGSAYTSGIDFTLMDQSVRPQDDIYLYAAGTWEKETDIPADKPLFTTYMVIRDRMDEAIKQIVLSESAKDKQEASTAELQIADFYNTYMDVAQIETLGLKPLQKELALIQAISAKSELPGVFAHLYTLGVTIPMNFGVFGDRKNPTSNILYIVQSGLGMPDRDYYLEDTERYRKIRAAYEKFLRSMLTYAAVENPDSKASAILALETRLATYQWTRVDSRDTDKTYNRKTIAELTDLAPGFDWSTFLHAAHLDAIDDVVIYQPDYLTGLTTIQNETDLPVWKDYLTARLMISAAPFLGDEIYAVYFDFAGRTLNGTEAPKPRWQRAISQLNDRMGEVVGKIFIKTWFPPTAKTRMDQMVANLLTAMDERLDTLNWMSSQTKQEAHAKLAKMEPQIGYPKRWRDYSKLKVTSGQLLENIWASNRFENQYEASKLGKDVDKQMWWSPPQTVNAFYSSTRNQVFFPAGYLQPPFFQLDADDAANYGSIGATIGHEIGHGFDDQGSKSDGDGRLRNWWTAEDRARFEARTQKLVAQFNHFCPFEDACLNGELSLGENIGDLAGIIIAYDAYQLSLHGKTAPVIDGLTGDQRFILGFAQSGKGKWRDEFVRSMILTDPHVPDKYRVLGPLQNFDVFYQAFDVKQGDRMYVAPENRVRIW